LLDSDKGLLSSVGCRWRGRLKGKHKRRRRRRRRRRKRRRRRRDEVRKKNGKKKSKGRVKRVDQPLLGYQFFLPFQHLRGVVSG
jgi:hypothetical protein